MIYFIAGILFWELAMPLLDKLFELFISRLSLAISEIAVKINFCQVQIDEMNDGGNSQHRDTKIVGFSYEADEPEPEFEVDDE